MRYSLLIIKHEIVTTLSNSSFWLIALLFPLFILLTTVVPSFGAEETMSVQETLLPTAPISSIGYVDEANLIESLPDPISPDTVRVFENEEVAQAAMQAGELDEYYLVPADYLASGQLILVTQVPQLTGEPASQRLFTYLLTYNLTGDEVLTAVFLQPTAAMHSHALAATAVDDSRSDPQSAAMGFAVPLIAMFIFFFLITMSSSFMLHSVSREKENRMAEVLLLSLEPRQLMLGKLIGLSVVALVQMAIWAGAGLFALNQGNITLDLLGGGGLSTGFFIWALCYFLLGYLMYAALLGTVGVLVPTAREGAQFTFFILLPLFIPIWFNYVFISVPNSLAAVSLSLFPLTAPVAMLTRMVVTEVPLWQLLASLLAQLGTAYLFVLLAARFFRADTLLADTALSWQRWRQVTAGRQ